MPVISIVGRPNVGKSTLFNRLTRSRDALVEDTPGVTRDRLYGVANYDGFSFLVVDTGGIGESDDFMSKTGIHPGRIRPPRVNRDHSPRGSHPGIDCS